MPTNAMSLKKRWRVLWAACFQTWHQNTCGECGAQWWAAGPAHPELIHICDVCELREMERFEAVMTTRFREQALRGDF